MIYNDVVTTLSSLTLRVGQIHAHTRVKLHAPAQHIRDKLYLWKRSVEDIGLEQVRKIPGYHDEPLHGDRKGQRSIRLSRAYRAIYVLGEDQSIKFVSIEEVNKHEY